MRYLDRDNEPIGRDRWWKYTLDSSYCRVRYFRNDDLELCLAWVGVYLHLSEPIARPFVLTAAGRCPKIDERLRVGVWLINESQGVLAFNVAKTALMGLPGGS